MPVSNITKDADINLLKLKLDVKNALISAIEAHTIGEVALLHCFIDKYNIFWTGAPFYPYIYICDFYTQIYVSSPRLLYLASSS
mgnify:CR=1 FL=1